MNNYTSILAGVSEELASMDAIQHSGLDEWEVNLQEKLTEPTYTIKSLGAGAFPLGDIQAIKAKSKSGKTYAASIFASVILGAKFGDLEAGLQDAKVCIFDTEQNKVNAMKVMRRIHTLLGWDTATNTDRLHVYSLRRMDLNVRREYIKAKTEQLRPQAVVIDGVADLMMNFNDVEESSQVIDWLMKLSADNNCAVVCILHENKGKDDTGMKGHLGTLLLQKASDIFQCSKENGHFKVTECDSRNLPIEDFCFAIDGHGIPFSTEDVKNLKTDTRKANEDARKKTALQKVFTTSATRLSYTELRTEYMRQSGVNVVRTAERHIQYALQEGWLFADGNSYGCKLPTPTLTDNSTDI